MRDSERKIKDYSIKELKEICHESMAHLRTDDNKLGLFITHKFSIYFIRLFLHTKITPNQITVLSVITFYIGIFLLTFNEHLLSIIGSLIILFSIILDACDGGVARFRGKTSTLGGFYAEPVSHDIQYGFAFLLISWGLVMHGFPSYYYILGGIAGLTKLSTRLLQSRFSDLLRPKMSDEEVADIHKSLKSKSIFVKITYRVNKNFFNNSGIFMVLFILSLINRIDLSLWFFGIGYSLIWIAMFVKQAYQIHKYNL